MMFHDLVCKILIKVTWHDDLAALEMKMVEVSTSLDEDLVRRFCQLMFSSTLCGVPCRDHEVAIYLYIYMYICI